MSIIGAAQQQSINRVLAVSGITYVGGASGSNTSTSSITLTLPTHQANDFALVTATGFEDDIVQTLADGWTLLIRNGTTQGDDMHSNVWYKKFASSSETNPVITTGTASKRSATVAIFRGVNTTTPFDVVYDNVLHFYSSVNTPDTQNGLAITTVTANSCLFLVAAYSVAEEIQSGGARAPTGFTVGPVIIGPHNDIRPLTTAYKLNAGVGGTTYTPTLWNHIFVATPNGETHFYTLALRAAT